MGESNSKPATNEDFLREFAKDYKEIQEVNDPRLGRVKVYEGSQSNYVAVKNTFAYNKEDIENFLESNLAQACDIRCKYLMKLHSYKTHSEESMCGSVNGITTYHEYYLNTLHDELLRRNQVSLFYLEAELWAILYSIISASAYLEKNNKLPLSDVRPTNIYFTPRGEIKLLPFGVYPEDHNAYSRRLNEECLLAPEQLQKTQANGSRSEISQVKCDVYAIGMTMLYSSTLQTNSPCYNYNDLSINKDFISQLFTFSRGQYSKFYNFILSVMLREKPEDRPTPSTIYGILQPFEKEILDLKTFYPDFEAVKQSLNDNGKLDTKEEENHFQDGQGVQHIDELQQSQITSLPFRGEDGQIYYQSTVPQQQYEYLIQQSDGRPIPQLENQFFTHVNSDQYSQQVIEHVQTSQVVQEPMYVSYQPQVQREYVLASSQSNVTYATPAYVQSQVVQPQYSQVVQPQYSQVVLQQSPQTYQYVAAQPQYSQVIYEQPQTSQVIVSPAPQQYIEQSYIQSPQPVYVPYGSNSQVVAQYTYSEKPLGNTVVVQNQQIPQTVSQNLIQEETIKRSKNKQESDMQLLNQEIQNFSLPSGNYTYNVQQTVANQEPQSPIGLVSQGYTYQNEGAPTQFNYQLTTTNTQPQVSSYTFNQPVASETYTQQRQTEDRQSSANYQIPVSNNQEILGMDDINHRINEALRRSQEVLGNAGQQY